MEEQDFNGAPSQALLKPESTMIITYTLLQDVSVEEVAEETVV